MSFNSANVSLTLYPVCLIAKMTSRRRNVLLGRLCAGLRRREIVLELERELSLRTKVVLL